LQIRTEDQVCSEFYALLLSVLSLSPVFHRTPPLAVIDRAFTFSYCCKDMYDLTYLCLVAPGEAKATYHLLDSIRLCLVLPPTSFYSCTWSPLSTFLASGHFPGIPGSASSSSYDSFRQSPKS